MNNMLDIDLLNFWIEKLDLFIYEDALYAKLYAPFFGKYHFFLSNDKKEILDFFGYDITCEYDNMTEKNMFEYLCTSTKLSHNDIKLSHPLKGDCLKTKTHVKFNTYLQNKYHIRDRLSFDEKREKLPDSCGRI